MLFWPTLLAVVLTLLLVGLGALLFFLPFWIHGPHFRVMGMAFRCNPKGMKNKINKKEIENLLKRYALQMAPIIAGVDKETLLEHFSTVGCEFKEGFLNNKARQEAGLEDSDEDGAEDKITGLTWSEKHIQVAVLYDSMLDEKSNIQVAKTAFLYEVHNTVIRKFFGYNVAIAESFIRPDNKAIQRITGTDEAGLAALLAQRAILDEQFQGIKL